MFHRPFSTSDCRQFEETTVQLVSPGALIVSEGSLAYLEFPDSQKPAMSAVHACATPVRKGGIYASYTSLLWITASERARSFERGTSGNVELVISCRKRIHLYRKYIRIQETSTVHRSYHLRTAL